MLLKEIFIHYSPNFLTNCAITVFNSYQYKIRHAGDYQKYKDYYTKFSIASKHDVEVEQKERLANFLNFSVNKSNWYSHYRKYESLNDFGILNKEDIINNMKDIATLSEKNAIVSLTGGTTGASMKVLYTKENMQERHAFLDSFRAQYGYTLGKKCVWFSGKNIVSEKNIKKGICYRDDYVNKIRFFSTFHITDSNFHIYWLAFRNFAPAYIVGFPSSVYELCSMAAVRGLKLENTVEAFFPTAETLLPIHREVISSVLGCKIADQYASSEGAPFILECEQGGMHIHPLTGIFEVVDEDMKPAQEGEILVTSFTTKGTPLIRYRIGDRIKLAPEDKQCVCGSHFPLVERIEGRATDYILSPTHGKVNLGNISNSTKNVAGVIQFQAIQHKSDCVEVLVVASNDFTDKEQKNFKLALAERFGPELKINLKIVDEIPKEKSGKFRLVKNMIGK
ncbi:phenylacetate--CoA ligase family protein [Psychrobacter urativorans]|uniref:Polysaccharide biosynthesis protein n=1 Tax=Psychrobacter urativorans TaxID=45610 RepID=A0A0M4T6N1_9GAMM|nr:phenylacetate--CoA ligase family protein [Psychrobacter urativorans]ALF59159.1 polysaccharide biosynthesis protein [Psychrobacter urativorans]